MADRKRTTKERLLKAAMEAFQESGFHGTDTNRIARKAGFAPGTFYRHFSDKLEIFVAVYEGWVEEEMSEIREIMKTEPYDLPLLKKMIASILQFHRRDHRFRGSLRALMATEPRLQKPRAQQRQKQLDELAQIQEKMGVSATHEERVLILLRIESTCDAIANGEIVSLGLDEEVILHHMSVKLAEDLGMNSLEVE